MYGYYDRKDNRGNKERMSAVYLIETVNFDSDENYNPIHIEILGYATTEKEAKSIIELLENTTPKHKGWNDELYPQFKSRRIKELKLINK